MLGGAPPAGPPSLARNARYRSWNVRCAPLCREYATRLTAAADGAGSAAEREALALARRCCSSASSALAAASAWSARRTAILASCTARAAACSLSWHAASLCSSSSLCRVLDCSNREINCARRPRSSAASAACFVCLAACSSGPQRDLCGARADRARPDGRDRSCGPANARGSTCVSIRRRRLPVLRARPARESAASLLLMGSRAAGHVRCLGLGARHQRAGGASGAELVNRCSSARQNAVATATGAAGGRDERTTRSFQPRTAPRARSWFAACVRRRSCLRAPAPLPAQRARRRT